MSSTAPTTAAQDAAEPTPSLAASAATQASTAPHQALYRRWRAQTFAEIVGQTAVVETLRNAVRADRVSHAVLFVGPRGTGKTSLARILAKALNCTNLQDGDPCDRCDSCVSIREGRALDLLEIDAASNRGIGDIRDLRERIQYAPTQLRRKVYILDEAHQITKEAWNALLKSLEEPPDFVAFMFASTHPQDFPPAILSRLQRFDVRRLTIEEIEGKLARILAAESVEAEPGAVRLIARLAAGGMRDAESILDQVLASAAGRIDEASVRDLLGLADADAIDRLTGALVDGDAGTGIAVLAELDERGRDVAVVLDQVLEQIRTDLAAAIGPGGQVDRASALSAAAHRLATIDPERRGVGGLRFQVELALLDAATRSASTGAPAAPVHAASASAPAPSAPPTPVTTTRAPAAPAARASTAKAPTAKAPTDEAPTDEASTDDALTAKGLTTTRPAAKAPTPAAASEPDHGGADRSPSVVPTPSEPVETQRPGPTPDSDSAKDERSGPSGIEELRTAWPAIVAVISQSPAVKPLIAACRPVSIDGAVVTLGFPEDQAFLKDLLERRRPIIEAGIAGVLGRPVTVRCVATNLDHVPAVPLAEAADLISEARRIFADDLVDVGEVS